MDASVPSSTDGTTGNKFSAVTITGEPITINDAQTQTFRLVDAPTEAVEEGDTIPPMSVEPRYTIGNMEHTVAVRLVDPADVASLTPTTSFMMNASTPSPAVVLALKANDGNTNQDQVTIEVVAGAFGSATVHDTTQIIVTDDTPTVVTSGALTFASTTVADPMPPAGAAMTSVQLPAVTNGTGTITYMVSALPPGLMFNAATRMLSGTPTTRQLRSPSPTPRRTAPHPRNRPSDVQHHRGGSGNNASDAHDDGHGRRDHCSRGWRSQDGRPGQDDWRDEAGARDRGGAHHAEGHGPVDPCSSSPRSGRRTRLLSTRRLRRR